MVGAWQDLSNIYVNDAGTWRDCERWVNDSGTWRLTHAIVGFPNTQISDSQVSPNDSISGFRVHGTLGTIVAVRGTSLGGASLTTLGSWTPVGTAANYDIMVEQISGTVNVNTGAGPASLNTWIQMNIANTGTFYSTRTTSIQGITQAVARLSFRPTGVGSAISTCLLTLNAEVVL
jgi:hypothetical protein